MRVVTVVGVLLASGAATLSAQHTHQLEFGGFGSYTRYDKTFQLNNQFGGGGRLGFFLNDYLSLEVDGNVAYPTPTAGGMHTQMRFGSASLVINSGGEHNLLYLLGGYSKLDMGVNPPYDFALNAVHAGLGDRIFLGRHLALRLEGRAYYAPTNCCLTGQPVFHFTGSAGLSVFLGSGGATAAPEIPKARRDSILALGGRVPEAQPSGGFGGPVGHAHQLEIGGFGSYTRYDHLFGLNNTFGEGGRLGFFLNETFGLEVDANLAMATPQAGGATTQTRFGSVSLVINSGGEGNTLYLLGGYSRLDMGVNPPYNFALHAVHGGLGERIFFGDRIALRLEARAYYAPSSCCLTPSWVGHVTGSAGLSVFLGGAGGAAPAPEIPKAKRDSILAAGGQVPETRPRGGPTYEQRASDWQHKWYWGAQGGLFVFHTNFESVSFEPTFGGHWLITGKKTALYVAYEESFFLSERHVTFVEPTNTVVPGNVSFKNARRIMVGVLAFPAQLRVEPYGGGGFMIMELLNPTANCQTCTSVGQAVQLQQEAEDAATKAFFWWMGGIDIKQGRLALYGHYVLTSSAANFLIQGTTHTFQGGIRYSLGSSREGITDRQ
jgi:hypothetical protein